jgi:hypothetical protein
MSIAACGGSSATPADMSSRPTTLYTLLLTGMSDGQTPRSRGPRSSPSNGVEVCFRFSHLWLRRRHRRSHHSGTLAKRGVCSWLYRVDQSCITAAGWGSVQPSARRSRSGQAPTTSTSAAYGIRAAPPRHCLPREPRDRHLRRGLRCPLAGIDYSLTQARSLLVAEEARPGVIAVTARHTRHRRLCTKMIDPACRPEQYHRLPRGALDQRPGVDYVLHHRGM